MNNLEPLTAILIIIATIVFVWLYIWPKFKKNTEVEIEGWKDIFKKILPSFIAKYFNLLFPIAIFLIIIGGLGIFADSQPSNSLFNAIFVSVLLFVCFFGLNKLIKLENPETGAGQQILLWGIYGLIIFTIIHNTFNLIITDNMYLVGMIGGISVLTLSWLMTQGPFKILLGGALLCSIFVLWSYINTGYFPFTNGESWQGYWPIIFIAIATIVLFITSYKQVKWHEMWSCWTIRGIATVIMCLMTPLVFLMMIGKISPDDIAKIARHNRVAHLSPTIKTNYYERDLGIDCILDELHRANKDVNNSSLTLQNAKAIADSATTAVIKAKKAQKIFELNALKKKSIEELVFSESFSLYREWKNKIFLTIVHLQL